MTHQRTTYEHHRHEIAQHLTLVIAESQLIRRRMDRGDDVDSGLIRAVLRRIETHVWAISQRVNDLSREKETHE